MDAKLLDFIDSQIGEPTPPRPDGFGITVKEYMAAKKVSKTVATNMLDKAVAMGAMDKRRMAMGMGNAPYVYFRKST